MPLYVYVYLCANSFSFFGGAPVCVTSLTTTKTCAIISRSCICAWTHWQHNEYGKDKKKAWASLLDVCKKATVPPHVTY